jgi:hypothetical protein
MAGQSRPQRWPPPERGAGHPPGTSRFLTEEKPDLVNKIVVDFLTTEPVPTVAPIRRAPKPETSPG